MTPDDRLTEDSVLARVAAARPALREADLSPDGERAAAILDRVLAAPGQRAGAHPPRSLRRWSPRWPSGFGVLVVAAVVAALVFVVVGLIGGGRGGSLPALGAHPLPTSDAVHLDSHGDLTPGELRHADRTPLGHAIAAQYLRIQEDIDTGTRAQNRRALQQLQFNQAACLHAASVVAAVHVPDAQRYLQYDWVQGARMQAREDGLFITGIRAFAAGDRAAGQRAFDAAGNLSNVSDLYGAYPLNTVIGLGGGPLPRAPGIEGPRGRRRAG